MNVQSMAMQDPVTDKKKAIFDSTLQLIREHGFHGTSMNGVAKNASVATGTIYHYFESKDQLICEIYDYYRDQLIKLIEEAIDNSQAFKENFQRIWFILYRSEEHTSELQSRGHLVCRLLLEKKKK